MEKRHIYCNFELFEIWSISIISGFEQTKMRGFDRHFATHTGGDNTGFCQIPPLIVPMYISGTFSVVACRICQIAYF